MDYQHINAAEAAEKLTRQTGYGDTGILVDSDATAAEVSYCGMCLRIGMLEAHGASADPDAVALARHATALQNTKAELLAVRDRMVTATGADVSAVMPEVLALNRAKCEQDYFDADWALTNIADLTADQTADLTLQRDRAEREAAVIDTWGS